MQPFYFLAQGFMEITAETSFFLQEVDLVSIYDDRQHLRIMQINSMASHVSQDNGNRRLEVDRRLFDYALHIPERRSGKERRCGLERKQETRN